jgi:hypothetical protein
MTCSHALSVKGVLSMQYAPDCVKPLGHCPTFGTAIGASRRIGTHYAASLA